MAKSDTVSLEIVGARARDYRAHAGLAKTVELVQTSWQQIEDAGVTYEVAGVRRRRVHTIRVAAAPRRRRRSPRDARRTNPARRASSSATSSASRPRRCRSSPSARRWDAASIGRAFGRLAGLLAATDRLVEALVDATRRRRAATGPQGTAWPAENPVESHSRRSRVSARDGSSPAAHPPRRRRPDAKVDDALFESAALRTHSAKVVATVAGAVKKLGQLEELAPVLAALGTKHVEYGVIPAHYEVVGEALIATLKDALGEAFTPEVKAAWVAVYGIVKTTMIGDNYPSEEPPRTPEDEDISTKTPNCKCTLI